MKLLKRVNRLFETLGRTPRDERPLDFHLTQEDVETELHYRAEEPPAENVRVTFAEAGSKR